MIIEKRHNRHVKEFIRSLAGWMTILLCTLATACTQEEAQPAAGEEGFPVTLRLDTKALGSGDETINTVRIIIARQNIGGTIVSNKFVNNPADPLLIEVQSGSCDVYVIANEAEKVGGSLATLNNASNVAALHTIKLPFTMRKGVSSDPMSSRINNIPMFAHIKDVQIIPAAGSPGPTNLADVYIDKVNQNKSLPADLDRLASRVKMTIQGKRNMTGTGTYTLSNLPDGVPLIPNIAYTPPAAMRQTLTLDATELASPSPLPSGFAWGVTADVLLPIYHFMPISDIGQAVRLTAMLGGQELSAAIGHNVGDATGNKDYTLRRNYEYTLTAIVESEATQLAVSLVPWNLREEQPELTPRSALLPTSSTGSSTLYNEDK